MQKYILLVVFCVAVIIIFSSSGHISRFVLASSVRLEYNNWCSSEYIDWGCSEKANECEKYFETVYDYSCYVVYGDNGKTCHMWNIVMIDDVPYEFESVSFEFKKVSVYYYNIHDVRHGFYIDGLEQGYCYGLDDWENLI